MLFSEEVPCSEDEAKCVLDFESKSDDFPSDSNDVRRRIVPTTDDNPTDENPTLTKLLEKHSHASPPPLIPNDVACTLLRIQSKFLDEHPCLCTSRFRRTLHQLDKESHLKLDKLCNDLQILDLENHTDAGEVRNFYTHFLPTVFDFQSLQLYVTPDVSPEESFKVRTSSEANAGEEPDKKRDVLILRLESILARFVSDYRAIFAIEGKCKHDDDFSINHHSIVDHEHRKRHDEEDVCPDEIKLMKVACAELTLECSSSSSSKTVSPAETPKKGKRPKSLPISAGGSTAATINNNAVEGALEPDKDHHIHRYYSFLRSQHTSTSRKGSRDHQQQHSSKDSNNSPRASLNQPSSNIHGQQTHYGQQAPCPSRSFLGPSEAKELSPGPLKWSPNISKSVSIFKFCKNSTPETEMKPTTEHVDSNASIVDSPSIASQRKRKDTRTNSEHTDSKKMSRSSSNILEEKTNSEVCSNLEMEEMLRRSKSYCEVSLALKNIENDADFGNNIAEVKKPEPPKGTCMFYVSDEEITLPGRQDEPDFAYSAATSRFATDDSNGSLNARFDRELEFGGRKSGHSGHSRSRLKYRRSRSRIEQPEPDESKSYSGGENSEKSLSYDDLEISPRRGLDQGDSFESSLSSSPSSCSSSITSDAGHMGEVEDEDEKDDDVTIKEDLATTSPTKLTFPQLRRASWENIEPAIQDHQQQLDTLEPVIMSWMPQLGLRRESSSSMSSDNTDDFSTRHVKILHSQKHSDPTHIQRLLTDDTTSKRSKLKYLGKQLKSLKHTMNDLETDFEIKHGYKPSHADKQNNDLMRRVLTDQYRIRKQIQICKESDGCIVEPGSTGSILASDDSFDSFHYNESSSSSYQTSSGGSLEKNKMLETMSIYFNSLVQTIKSQRIISGRPYSFDEMTSDQLLDEKKELKSALFRFAETFGHPDTDEVKNLTRDVHDRYLFVKRLIRKNSANFRAKESSELETIPEDLEIPLTLASPQHRINIEVTSISIERSSEVRPSFKCQSASLKIIEENLHAMSRYELLEIQQRTREEKNHYRRIIKEKEEKYMKDNVLRRIPKEEKSKIDEINYNLYKKSKAKLKLIEALLSKGRQ